MKDFKELAEVHPIEKEAAAIQGSVESIMSSLFTDKKMIISCQLTSAWEEFMPQAVLNHTGSIFITTEKSIRTVVVLVDSSMVAAELNARSFTYLVKLNVLFEKKYHAVGSVDRLKFKVSRMVSKRKEYKKRVESNPSYIEECTPASLSEEEIRWIDRVASSLPDERQQIGFKNAMKRNFSWKKGLRNAK